MCSAGTRSEAMTMTAENQQTGVLAQHQAIDPAPQRLPACTR